MIVPAVDATPSAATGLSGFDNSFVRDLDGLYQPWTATQASDPVLLALNVGLAHELGADSEVLRSPVGVAALVGNTVPDGAEPVAQAYAGHQFGGFSPRLGDGRALLLGEIIGIDGRRRDVHLKGSGRTPFARGGDGLASVGPMLREYLMCEAMHALGVPTTRALSVVATGDRVMRETPLPGAVFARVASSHLRVGTFQFAATSDEPSLLNRLADHAIARHHPDVADDGNRYVAFFDAVMDAQASLVAQWMLVGFVHGVMNTDNTTISGETIDYGPCAFLDAYDPATVFSSIDHGGRYAYGNQPGIVQWNLARLAETLLPLFGHDTDDAVAVATERLNTFPDRYRNRWRTGMWAKLGFVAPPSDDALVDDLLSLLEADRVDFTSFFRNLSEAMRDDEAPVRQLFTDPAGYDAWSPRWREAQAADDRPRSRVADEMDRVNPLYVPRNHLVEEALAAAVDGDTIGDLAPFERLIEVLTDPFTARPGLERYARPAPGGFTDGYRTFCGT